MGYLRKGVRQVRRGQAVRLAALLLGSGEDGRARWTAVVTIFLLATSVPLVLAESPDGEAGASTSEASDSQRYFDGRPVPPDLGEFEQEEAERKEWLAGPEAVRQREESWRAYGDLSPAESEGLLRSVFARQLAALNADPSRSLSDSQLVRPLPGGSDAVVREGGEGALLDSSVPVRVENEAGELAKVDLSLRATPEGYETVNAHSDLRLPLSADEEIGVGGEGFTISQAGAGERPARRFGDKNLFYPEVLPDTDLLVAGISSGVELFNLLRSKRSPESLRFNLDLPEGAGLSANGLGGAEVRRDGETLLRIAPPVATDAQGTDVPVELEVEAGAIVLHVPHREGDFAAPILVDRSSRTGPIPAKIGTKVTTSTR